MLYIHRSYIGSKNHSATLQDLPYYHYLSGKPQRFSNFLLLAHLMKGTGLESAWSVFAILCSLCAPSCLRTGGPITPICTDTFLFHRQPPSCLGLHPEVGLSKPQHLGTCQCNLKDLSQLLRKSPMKGDTRRRTHVERHDRVLIGSLKAAIAIFSIWYLSPSHFESPDLPSSLDTGTRLQ